MKNACLLAPALASLVVAVQPLPIRAASFADAVVAYNPGVGYATEFGSGIGYTNPLVVLGQPNRDTAFGPVTPFNPPFSRNEIVSIGTNGSLVVRFDIPILNDPGHPFGLDFIIYGSAGFIDADFPNGRTDANASMFGNNPGLSRVSVSSGDGIFYTLNPFLAPTVDTLYPTDGTGTFGLPINPALRPEDLANRTLSEIRALYAGSAGGAGYDLSWAVDGNGQPVNLSSINLVRIDVLSGRAEIDGFALVPEPSVWAVSGLGLAMLWSLRRRSHSKRPREKEAAVRKTRLAARFGCFHSLVIRQLSIAIRHFILIAFAVLQSDAANFIEDFATDPIQRGWRKLGDSSLFKWNSTNQNLVVTWDSSKSNSYFCHPLGNILAKSDDFSFGFDLRLGLVRAGANPEKPSTFEIAAGFINMSAATNAEFSRGTGRDSPNLVEFDYFPAADFITATVSPAIVSSNSQFATSFTFPLEMTVEDWFHVELSYTASNEILVTTMMRGGELVGPIENVQLSRSFTDFRVDAFAVSSYNDAGDAFGSVLAMGVIDNISVSLPAPPVSDITANLSNGVGRVEFGSRTNWIYTLEYTGDLRVWMAIPPARRGLDGRLTLADRGVADTQRFYRVRADRP